MSRESIDEGEARWLLARIAEDDMVHENEVALLKFIRVPAPAHSICCCRSCSGR